MIYDEFKQDYYPGEDVTATTENGDRVHGLVRDKTTFGPRVLPDGTRTKPVTRYLVSIKDAEKESIFTDDNISRDRGTFTKAMLRSFIKKTVEREAWTGAPWLVKQDYANQYHIDTRVPAHLLHDTKIQERKQLQAQKRSSDVNGHGPARLPDLKPSKPAKAKASTGKGLKWPGIPGGLNGAADHPVKREPSPPPQPPQPKYPIEDLQLEPNQETLRPRLKFMCRDAPNAARTEEDVGKQIDMASVGGLLETWDTLNVYCEIFKLDSFTFDDFVEAMSVASEQLEVQLFDEIHCAVLKILVDSEQDGGKVRITLPEIEEDDSDEEEDGEKEEEEEEEESEEEEPEPVKKPSGRATRSSLAKQEAERLAKEAAAEEEETIKAEIESRTRAEELMKEYDWVDHLRKRDFQNGGWERIVVGLLHQLSKGEKRQAMYEELLHQLVPPDTDPTVEAARENYAELDVNVRVQILQILCLLTMETKTVRGYMEECSETMTRYRKDRVEWVRQRKQAAEELRLLNEQRKAMEPETPADGEAKTEEEDVKMNGADDTITEKEDEAESNEDASTQKKRRGRKVDHRRKREEEEAARKAKEKARKEAAKASAQSKQYNKLLREIEKKEEIIKECEEEVQTIENDLREADCPRTRVLGKDRFWNRYYWFERNGMPYAGLPDSSTASAGYANGRLWIQGPDELEREGYIDVPPEMQNEYKAKFKMTVRERKTKEEGGTSMESASQWGYLADVESLDGLIKWLDPRGFNELRLRKELVIYRDKIAEHMEKRQQYLSGHEERETHTRREGPKRTSSRIRERTPEPPNYRCLQWENSMAMEELGHLHGDPPPPPRLRKQTKKREAAMAEAAPATRPSKTRRR